MRTISRLQKKKGRNREKVDQVESAETIRFKAEHSVITVNVNELNLTVKRN